jgi:predicted acyl esterase
MMIRPFRTACFGIAVLVATAGVSLFAFTTQTIMMPMRDGVRLATDVHLPFGNVPRPTILIRTPYGRGSGADDLLLFLLTDLKGYAVAIQDLRGRGGSEGIDSLFFSDGWGRVSDGYDAVEWTAGQPWCNGKIGTWGASGLGIPQYMAAGTNPPHLKCCLVIVAASNLYEDAIFYGGEYQKALVDGWLSAVKTTNLASFFIRHPNEDPCYDIVNLSTRYDSVRVPILHISGWHDIFVQGVINAFAGVQTYGGHGAAGKQKLIVGPWVHDITSASTGELTFPNSSYVQFLELQINWFDRWLKEADNGADRIPPVQYYAMGDADKPQGPGNRWISRNDWPPPSRDMPLYLSSGGLLRTEKPPATGQPEQFSFDPKNPVPTSGGKNLNIKAGSYDQRSVESRPDVLVFTSPPVTDSLSVAGRVFVTLWASSDGLDTDFTAKLCDVYPDGRSMLVADGIVQARHRNSFKKEELLEPGKMVEFTIDLWSTAVTFAPGHAVRLSVSSSNDPRFEPNPNTGEPFRSKNGIFRIAQQTVYHDLNHASALHLPVVSGGLSAVHRADHTVPAGFTLKQNFPNPFNSETVIPIFILDGLGRTGAYVEMMDVSGRRIRSWNLDGIGKGETFVRWRGDDENGLGVPSGIYFCRLVTGMKFQTVKITLLR